MLFKLKFKGLFDGFAIKDLFVLLIFPTIITLLMLLPDSIRIGMMFNIKDPHWWQFLSSGFMHQTWSHLKNNLVGYFLFVFPLFFLITTRTSKKIYYFKFLIFISLTFPIISSIFRIYFYPNIFPNLIYLTGSSGIIAAFSGLIPSFWLLSVANRNKLRIKKRFALINIFYLILSLLFVYYSLYKNLYLILIPILLFISLLFFYRKGILSILIEISKETQRNFILALILILVPILFVFTPKFFFPKLSVLVNNGTFTDFLVHYLGIAYGLIVSFYFFIFVHKETR